MEFNRIIKLLRKERGITQKQAAEDLGVSQALLSHYEKGIRECGLDFVVRVADYYNVSCDYLLGRSAERNGMMLSAEDLPNPEKMKDNVYHGSVLPTMNKKLISNSLNVLYAKIGQCHSKALTTEVSAYLMMAVAKMFRLLYSAEPHNASSMFSIGAHRWRGYSDAVMRMSEANVEALLAGEDLNGDGVISYVMFKGQEGNAEAEARTQFGVEDANAVLTAAGKPELAYYNASATDKYLVDQGGKWSAQAANDYMATILPEYSEANGNMVELIICNNDGMAEGAVSALQGAGYNTGDGKTIPVFGVDATDSAKQLINEGKMTGTIKQDAEGMANGIAYLAKNIQSGKELMADTDSFNISEKVSNKIYIPYATYTGE